MAWGAQKAAPEAYSMHFLALKSCSSPALSTKRNSMPRPDTLRCAVHFLHSTTAGLEHVLAHVLSACQPGWLAGSRRPFGSLLPAVWWALPSWR